MAEEQNFYFALGLRVNPPEENERVIQDAIVKKQAEWSEMLRGKDQNYAQSMLDMLPDIKKVMLNPSSRKEEAKRASATQKRILDQCVNTLVMLGKNKRPDASAFSKMAQKNARYGITQALLEKSYDDVIKGKGKDSGGEQESFEMPDLSVRKTIRKHLEILNLHDLYEFLGCSSSDSCSTLTSAAEKIYTNMIQQPNKTAKVSASQELAGTCKMQFKDAPSKKKYDNFLAYTKYPDVLEQLTTIGKGNDKTIDTASYKQILAFACDTYHISVGEATAYIELCCRVNKYDLGDNLKVTCAACGAENSGKAVQCCKCGRPLHVFCPKCGADNNNVAEVCAKCRFSLKDMGKALPLIAKAREAIKLHQLSAAGQALTAAEEFWPGHPDLEETSSRYQELVKQENETVAAIKHAIEKLEIIRARDLLQQARNNNITVPSDYAAHIKTVLEAVAKSISCAHGQEPDAAFETLLEARTHIVDYAELNAMLQNYPPNACSRVEANQINARAEIVWSPSDSRGNILYEVIRKENSPAISIQDGTPVYTGAAVNCVDNTLEPGKEYYYSVFTVREGVYSRTASVSKPIARVQELSQLEYVPGDGQCTVRWMAPSSVSSINVIRTSQTGEKKELLQVRNDGFTDRGLTNGMSYDYAITATHSINGNSYTASPVSIRAIPVPESHPIEDLQIRNDGAVLTAQWTQDDFADVTLMMARNYIPTIGESYLQDKVSREFDQLSIQSQGKGVAKFTLFGVNEATIIPFITQGSYFIAGTPCRVINIPKPKGLTGDVIQGNIICLNLSEWPRGIKSLRILYRNDAYPESADDPLANGINCTKDKYENDAGVLIQNVPFGDYYFSVFSEERSKNGERLYSDAEQVRVALQPIQDIVYSLTYKKGFLSRNGTLTLKIFTKATSIPRFVLVQKAGVPPLNRASGEVIYASEGAVEIYNGVLEMPVQWSTSDKNKHYVKMFFAAEKEYNHYTLRTDTPNVIG